MPVPAGIVWKTNEGKAVSCSGAGSGVHRRARWASEWAYLAAVDDVDFGDAAGRHGGALVEST